MTSLFLQVEGNFYVNDALEKLIFEELRNACRGGGQLLFLLFLSPDPASSASLSPSLSPSGFGGFLPAMKQIGNVAALPGIVHVSHMTVCGEAPEVLQPD